MAHSAMFATLNHSDIEWHHFHEPSHSHNHVDKSPHRPIIVQQPYSWSHQTTESCGITPLSQPWLTPLQHNRSHTLVTVLGSPLPPQHHTRTIIAQHSNDTRLWVGITAPSLTHVSLQTGCDARCLHSTAHINHTWIS
jgi:hypothetical protein